MRRRFAPERHILAEEAWPEADRRLWAALTAPGATLLDEDGAFARLRPASKASRRQSYAHWLNHLRLAFPDRLALPPADRITRETVASWLGLLARTVAPYTRLMRATHLKVIAHAAAPERDWAFLARAVRGLQSAAVPSRNKAERLRPSGELFRLGLALMRHAEAAAARTPCLAAVRYRDGLMIALLALRPLRLRNLAGLSLGRTLQRDTAGWRIVVPGEETKTHRLLDLPWPEELAAPLARWLAVHRCRLGRTEPDGPLWVGLAGQALAAHTIRQVIIGRTEAGLGVRINPHLFRDTAATTLAIEDPAHIGIASVVLGHADPRVTAKHYIHARTIVASRRHGDAVGALRRDLAATVRRPRHRARPFRAGLFAHLERKDPIPQ